MAEELRNLIDRKYVSEVGKELKLLIPNVSIECFVQRTMISWSDLGLNQRVSALRRSMEFYLPDEYNEAREYILMLAPKLNSGYAAVFIPEYISRKGLDSPNEALEDLAYVTRFSTSEFAIRPFLEKYPEQSMQQMLAWTSDENEHVRRLTSEGCRPRLPWGGSLKNFIQDPSPIFPILEKLKSDSSLYVRKSVANNLNDISKDHPGRVLEIAQKWAGHSKHTDWILKRGLRSLLKEGRPEALQLFGYGIGNQFELQNVSFSSSEIEWESHLFWEFEVKNPKTEQMKLRLEYKMHFKRKHGSNAKVFQIGEYELNPNESLQLQRKHSFKELSTRKHQPGVHKIELMVNGLARFEHSFTLKPMK